MTKSRNKYQDIGCSKYIYITEGGNCEICDSLDGQVFSISEARPGINFAPIHPHCDCAAGILDDNGNIVSLIGNENNNNFNDKKDTGDGSMSPIQVILKTQQLFILQVLIHYQKTLKKKLI